MEEEDEIYLIREIFNVCLDENSLTRIFKNQISSLVISISNDRKASSPKNADTIIFTHIFAMFQNLQYLNFGPSSLYHQRLSFHASPLTVISTKLLKLHVRLDNFDDCLYLLDGRFNQLRTLHVDICLIHSQHITIKNQVERF